MIRTRDTKQNTIAAVEQTGRFVSAVRLERGRWLSREETVRLVRSGVDVFVGTVALDVVSAFGEKWLRLDGQPIPADDFGDVPRVAVTVRKSA